MSASSLPRQVTSGSNSEITPREKFDPVRLVNTLYPTACSSSVTTFVVVVLPLVPDTNTTPPGRGSRVRLRYPRSILSTTSPGSAEPLPLSRATRLTSFPIMVLMV